MGMDIKAPSIGETRQGRDVGHIRRPDAYKMYIYLACELCSKRRWVKMEGGKPAGKTEGTICKLCAVRKYGMNKPGKGSSAWAGGRALTTDGYVNIYLESDDFFYPMANESHYVREHRLVMAKSIGRCLQEWEVVHHKGVHFPMDSIENKSDNSLENLQLVTDGRHRQITILENRIEYQKREIASLKAQIVELRARLLQPV